MKLVILAAFAFLSAELTFAGELDGKKFCREVPTGGMFGQPDEVRSHCVSFKGDVMTDNGNTFFGNPPESIHYVLVANKILVVRDGNLFSDYIVGDQTKTIKNSVGATLELK